MTVTEQDAIVLCLDLVRSLKYEAKYQSLNMMDKMDFRKTMLNVFVNLAKENSEKIEFLTPEFVLEHINERGYNRLRKLKEFKSSIDKMAFDNMTKDSMKKMIFKSE